MMEKDDKFIVDKKNYCERTSIDEIVVSNPKEIAWATIPS